LRNKQVNYEYYEIDATTILTLFLIALAGSRTARGHWTPSKGVVRLPLGSLE
jgi:hypothetical protein